MVNEQAQLTAGPPKAIAHRNTRFVAPSAQSGASTPGGSTPGGIDTDSIAGSNPAGISCSQAAIDAEVPALPRDIMWSCVRLTVFVVGFFNFHCLQALAAMKWCPVSMAASIPTTIACWRRLR